MSIQSQRTEQPDKTMTSYLAPRVREIQPSGIRRFFDLASGSKDIITLGVGEPDFITPWHVREACVYSLERGYTSYTSNAGTPELREAIAEYLDTSYHVKYNPKDEILVTVGGSEAIDLALRALIEPGDEILVPVPCYISYSPIASIGEECRLKSRLMPATNSSCKLKTLRRKSRPSRRFLF